ncbi:hypothetical protein CRUP_013281 [Coryphaenoides rupestris]|nr:hypothetical protein CRUP_013281 [Coryphaenoides rupestris]
MEDANKANRLCVGSAEGERTESLPPGGGEVEGRIHDSDSQTADTGGFDDEAIPPTELLQGCGAEGPFLESPAGLPFHNNKTGVEEAEEEVGRGGGGGGERRRWRRGEEEVESGGGDEEEVGRGGGREKEVGERRGREEEVGKRRKEELETGGGGVELVERRSVEKCQAAAFGIFHALSGPGWSAGDWGPCSVTCGGGKQSRALRCLRKVTYQREEAVARALCPAAAAPAQLQPCHTQACPPEWSTGAWSQGVHNGDKS